MATKSTAARTYAANYDTREKAIEASKRLAVEADASNSHIPGLWPYRIGQAYLVQTVTHYWSGVIIGGNDREILLGDAAWIPETGRLNEVVSTADFNECEPINDPVVLARGAIVSAVTLPVAPRGIK